MTACACVQLRVRACVHDCVCVRACVRACMTACACVRACMPACTRDECAPGMRSMKASTARRFIVGKYALACSVCVCLLQARPVVFCFKHSTPALGRPSRDPQTTALSAQTPPSPSPSHAVAHQLRGARAPHQLCGASARTYLPTCNAVGGGCAPSHIRVASGATVAGRGMAWRGWVPRPVRAEARKPNGRIDPLIRLTRPDCVGADCKRRFVCGLRLFVARTAFLFDGARPGVARADDEDVANPRDVLGLHSVRPCGHISHEALRGPAM